LCVGSQGRQNSNELDSTVSLLSFGMK